jgi:3-hydroxy-3-methylglutaryl CoA synthase
MVGITSYGAYIPWLRINRKIISSAMGWFNPAALPGEKAVANYDEDSVTMAVAAGVDCINNVGRDKIEGLYFATTTSPYKERQGAGIIAAALDVRPDIRTADFTDSTKAGTTALIAACEAIEAGAMKNLLLCASDCRLGKAGGSQEQSYGDSAAALLIGDSDVVASLEGTYSVSEDFMGHWRAEGDKFDRTWEDRFIRDEGYTRLIPEVISGLLQKYQLSISDFAKIVYTCPYAREHGAIGKKLGVEPGRIQAPMLDTIGDSGAAYPLAMLVAALEEAKAGDKILVVSFGNGSDALFFQVTEEIEKVRDRRGIKGHLASKQELDNYEKYVSFHNMVPIEKGIRGEETAFTQVSTLWRERKSVLALCGAKCKKCGTPQYPYQRVCVNPGCGAIDEMEYYRFSDKRGKLFTYTGDSLAFSPSPPAIYGLMDFEGGGRYWFDVTDCELSSVEVNMPVVMSFRRKYLDEPRGISGYFWKATPRLA